MFLAIFYVIRNLSYSPYNFETTNGHTLELFGPPVSVREEKKYRAFLKLLVNAYIYYHRLQSERDSNGNYSEVFEKLILPGN